VACTTIGGQVLCGWLLVGACFARMTGGSVAEPSYAYVGFLPKQIVSGCFEQAKSRRLLLQCYPKALGDLDWIAKLLIL
jgi:hypothetical protein